MYELAYVASCPLSAVTCPSLPSACLPSLFSAVVSLLYYTHIQTQDQLVTMLIRRVVAIHQQAREKLEALLTQERSTMESWMQAMAEITRTVARSGR